MRYEEICVRRGRMRVKATILSIICCFIAPNTIAIKNYHYVARENINHLFQQAFQDHAFPGGCLIVGTTDLVISKKCYGHHTYKRKIADSTIDSFDLASLTKAIGTTTAIMKLFEQGHLHLSDKVVDYVPEFSGPNELHSQIKKTITIEDLLTHRSGLQYPFPVERMTNSTIEQRWKYLFQTPLKYYPKRKEVYSDLNFILLGKIVERITKQNLDNYLRISVFYPLEMMHTGFFPHEKTCTIVPTFSEESVGVVHDPIARAMGGVCGHAGLFSTANDLQHFAQMILNNGRYKNKLFLNKGTLDTFFERNTLLAHSTRALGWDTAYNPDDSETPHQFSAGYYSDPDAVGHTGYTGTSIWFSQKHGLYVILLTNRVFKNPAPTHRAADRYWRQRIASAVWKNLGFTQESPLYHELYVGGLKKSILK